MRGEGADHADPAEVLLHHARQHAELFLQREPAGAQPEARHHGPPGGEGDEAERDDPEQRLAAEQQRCARADQDREQHEADQPGVDHHPDALDIEHPAGDQLAGVHAVMEADAQALQLLVVRHAQVVGEALPDRFALVVVPHREQAAQHGSDEQQGGGVPQGRARGDLIAAGQQALRRIDGLPEIARDQELKDRSDDRGRHRDRHAPFVAQRHAKHAQQNPEVRDLHAGGVSRLRPGSDRTGGIHGRPGRAMGDLL